MNQYLNQPEVLTYLRDQGIKRGDVIEITEVSGYRNDGLAIWDGNKVQELDCDLDDYGAVPNTFFVGEGFLADHWSDAICHNNIVHINTKDPNIKQQLIDNFTPQKTSFTTDMGTFTIQFSYQDVIEADDPDSGIPTGLPYVVRKTSASLDRFS